MICVFHNLPVDLYFTAHALITESIKDISIQPL